MNWNAISVSDPLRCDNLQLVFLRGPDATQSTFVPLGAALEQGLVIVHETSQVGELQVENVSDAHDVFIQAGDVVKGGRQDRTLVVDFIVPPRSGRLPIPSFCVENGRWRKRATEDVATFSASTATVAPKALRLATKVAKDQTAVWSNIAETQASLNAALRTNTAATASPTSYQLASEHPDVQNSIASCRAQLAPALDRHPDALGFAFAINDTLNSADIYGSSALFRSLWDKLLNAAILEALAAKGRSGPSDASALAPQRIVEWLRTSAEGALVSCDDLPPRTRFAVRRSAHSFAFETFDQRRPGASVHTNVVTV